MIRIVALLLAVSLTAAAGERIFYSKDQPGSRPSYVQIIVERDGAGVYRESVDDPDDIPVEFRLRKEEVDTIFDLAGKLDYFRRPLESHLKVANLGMKTFRYENGSQTNEQKFNYSKDPDAILLADWFARITESEQHFLNLERTARFDKLGINKVLLQIQIAMERNRLVAPDQFLSLLDKVSVNHSYLNMARSRAAGLAELIRASGKKTAQ